MCEYELKSKMDRHSKWSTDNDADGEHGMKWMSVRDKWDNKRYTIRSIYTVTNIKQKWTKAE